MLIVANAWAIDSPNCAGLRYPRYKSVFTHSVSEQDISRGHFVINLMTEAMAPTNTAANPAAVKRFFETGGKSLLDGLSHLAKRV